MPRPVEDRSDVGGAAQLNNIGPVPLSCPVPLFCPRGQTVNSHDRTFTGKSNGIMGCRTRSDPSLDPSLPTRTPHYRPGTGGAAPLAKVTDLAGIRDAPALANLPADEQNAFTQLWADVAALLKKAARDLVLAAVNYAVVARLGKARLGSVAGATRRARERS